MTSKNQKLAVKNHILDLYPFAYALIPDELQARQLVIDAFALGTLENSLEEFLQDKMLNFKELFELAKKRHGQIHGGIEKKSSAYFDLNFEVRACLYLKYKCGIESEQIGLVTSLDKTQVISLLNIGKKEFFSLKGFSPVHDFNFL